MEPPKNPASIPPIPGPRKLGGFGSRASPLAPGTSVLGGVNSGMIFGMGSAQINPSVAKVQTALQLSMSISQHLRKVQAEDIREFGRVNELLRAALLRLQSSPSVTHDPNTQVWVEACLDMLFPLANTLQSWQDSGCLGQYLTDAQHHKRIDRHFSRISVHAALIRKSFGARAQLLGSTVQSMDQSTSLAQVTHMIGDQQGREFWTETFGSFKYSVPWSDLHSAMVQKLEPRALLADKAVMYHMRQYLDPSGEDKVTAYKWGEFLDENGPGVLHAAQQLRSVKGEPWFAGFISFDESCNILRSCSPGAFLVRFSRTQPCGFAVAFVDIATGEVTQTLVTARSPKGKVGARVGFEMDGTLYPSLSVLVDSNSSTLKFPAPTLEHQRNSSFFKGYINFDEANALLEGKPKGYFLIRFSHEYPAALVVAFVVADGSVQQSIINCEPDSGGFRLGDRIYTTLDKLIDENSDQLQYPLVAMAEDVDASNNIGATLEQTEPQTELAAAASHVTQDRTVAGADPSLGYDSVPSTGIEQDMGNLMSASGVEVNQGSMGCTDPTSVPGFYESVPTGSNLQQHRQQVNHTELGSKTLITEEYATVPAVAASTAEEYATVPAVASTTAEEYANVPAVTSTTAEEYATVPAVASTTAEEYANVPAVASTTAEEYANVPAVASTAAEEYAAVPSHEMVQSCNGLGNVTTQSCRNGNLNSNGEVQQIDTGEYTTLPNAT